MRPTLSSLLALSLCLLAGCATTTTTLPLYRGRPGEPFAQPPAQGGWVEVTYLGVGGYVVRRGSDALLFAPSFSNPDLISIAFARAEPNQRKVDQCMQGVPIGDVEWVITGHSHYDHLLDVPYIMKRYAPNAKLVAPPTASHMLAAVLPEERILRQVGDSADSAERPGQWIYNCRRTVRVMPLKSEHSSHFCGIKLLRTGTYSKDLEALPRSNFLGWKEGETYAYLVDFLNPTDGSVDFRIHYQDAASRPPRGFAPEEILQHPPAVDLAILCTGAYTESRGYPDDLLRTLNPRHVLLGHWENFFGNACRGEQRVLFTMGTGRVQRLIQRVEENAPGAKWILPSLPSRMYLPKAQSR
jgi:L-ascorbate metabolism protein UlaG (beta-lactamase superfamily)